MTKLFTTIGAPAGTGTTTVVGQGPTTFPTYDGDTFGARLERNFPRGWAGDDAVHDGGVADALFDTVGSALARILVDMQYALHSTRIQTETYPEMDLASDDLFGLNGLNRPAGFTDAQFYQLILHNLFKKSITRKAISDALTALTGSIPRMLEPWDINDTGHWNGNPQIAGTYWNVDTVPNPGRWGNGGLRYQGFIETAQPATAAFGTGSPVECWGGTAGAGSAYWNNPGYFFGIIQPIATNSVYDLINKLKAEGTTIWTKIVSAATLVSAVQPNAPTNLIVTNTSINSVSLAWNVPTSGTVPFTYTIYYSVQGSGVFLTGPSVNNPSVTVSNLTSGLTYLFEVSASNIAGNSPTSTTVSAVTASVAPSQAVNVTATLVQANAVTLTWGPPIVGTPPFTYTVLYRVNGTVSWGTLFVGQSVIGVTVIGLLANTLYDFEVETTNN